MVMPAWDDEDGGTGSAAATSSFGVSAPLASGELVRLSAGRPAAMSVISFFCSDERLPQRALDHEEAMAGVVPRGERERRRLDEALVGPGV